MLRRVALCASSWGSCPGPASVRTGGVAEVNGNVTDQTGSLLPGVTFTVTGEGIGLQRTVVSNESGRFVVPQSSRAIHDSGRAFGLSNTNTHRRRRCSSARRYVQHVVAGWG